MPADHSPTIRRRRLGTELRRLRERAGLTAEQVGKHLDCHASKVGRIENGRSGLRLPDLRGMLDLYGVDDEDTRRSLSDLAREGKKRGWWRMYEDVLTPSAAEFVSLEAAADSIRSFEPLLVPGLLQTEDYARTVIRSGRPDLDADDAEPRVRLRMERQATLRGPRPPHLWAVVGEAALRNQVGGASVMSEQIQHLLTVSERPDVTVQVMPFTVGAHPGIGGPFVVLGFPGQDEPEVILVEATASSHLLESEEQVSHYRSVFDHIHAAALGPEQSQEMLRRTLRDYTRV